MAGSPLSGPTRLDGQIALITGAAGGIGRAVVAAFCEAGADVIATDIVADGGEFPSESVSYRRYDVTSRGNRGADRRRAEEARQDRHSGAVRRHHRPHAAARSTDEEWESIFAVNVVASSTRRASCSR